MDSQVRTAVYASKGLVILLAQSSCIIGKTFCYGKEINLMTIFHTENEQVYQKTPNLARQKQMRFLNVNRINSLNLLDF